LRHIINEGTAPERTHDSRVHIVTEEEDHIEENHKHTPIAAMAHIGHRRSRSGGKAPSPAMSPSPLRRPGSTSAASGSASGFAPDRAAEIWASSLTACEREELQALDTNVFWVSPMNAKSGSDPEAGVFNDDKGRYLGTVGDHIAYRYETQSVLGSGAFGTVYKALDHKTGSIVACKIIRDERRFHRQAKVEIDVLEDIGSAGGAQVAIALLDHILFRGHVVLIFELAGADLYHKLKADGFCGFPIDEVQQIGREIAECLDLCADLAIVHADLKPENVLLTTEGVHVTTGRRVKVIDFGSACREHGKVHTYIQSRYYRSPEVVMGQGYGTPIDMWSLGCVLAELYTGRPLFPAKSEVELMLLVAELLGLPSAAVLRKSQRGEELFPAGLLASRRDRKGRVRRPGSRSLKDALGTEDVDLLDFISGCLTWDPAQRMTPSDALQHPFLRLRTPLRRPSARSIERSPLHRVLASSHGSAAGDSGVDEGDHASAMEVDEPVVPGSIAVPSCARALWAS